MGRTNATYRDLLRAVESRWADYRRGLRRDDQAHFDRLFTHARNYADASGLRNHEDPIVPVLVSISLAQEKQLDALETRLDELEAIADGQLDEPEATIDTQLDESVATTDTQLDGCEATIDTQFDEPEDDVQG